MNRDARLHQEAVTLWRALTSEPPPEGLYGASLLSAAIALRPAPDYDRIHSPHLRPSQITRPN